MRLAYIAPLPIDFDRLGGVQKKVLSHVNHLSKYFETLLFYYCDGKARVKNINKHTDNEIGFAKSKLGLLVCITRYFKKCDDITAVYCRYPDSDFFFVRMLRVMKRSNAKIVVEIPTYPYHNEGDSSFRSRIIKMLDCFFRRFMRLYVDRKRKENN